jgi:hypothetical protein
MSSSHDMPPTHAWTDSQAQVLADTWLLTLFVVMLAIALPWFVSAFKIDFALASWALLLLGVICAGIVVVANLEPPVSALRLRGLTALHAAGLIALGFVWQRSGGLQNPVFLLSFALPVIGACALSRWQPYGSAAIAVLAVGAVALAEAPELRWYAGGLQELGRWLMRFLGAATQGGDAGSAFPGFYAPVGYDVVLLEVFAILILACAVAAESLGNAFEKLLDHLRVARSEAVRGEGLWTTLVQRLPLPALLVDADTLQIVLTSNRLEPFYPPDTNLVGRDILEAVPFSYPEQVQEMIVGEGGVAAAVVVHGADDLRMANVRVQHLGYEGQRLALVLIEDVTSAFNAAAALDAQEHAVIVINALGRVVSVNKTARALFPEVLPGRDARQVLSRPNPTSSWWDPGVTGRRRLNVSHQERPYLATCTTVALPGEKQALYVATFTPLMPAATLAARSVTQR